MTLPAFAAAAPCCTAPAEQQSISIFCPHGAQQQTRRTSVLLSIDGTDGRTPDRFIDPVAHSVEAVCQ